MPGQIADVFFTHHHFDHNADFPCFALTRWDLSQGTEPPLRVYGPPPTRTFVERLFGENGAFADDLESRIRHPASQEVHRRRGGVLPRPGLAIEVEDIEPGKVAETDAWVATAERVHHVEPWLESLVYRFDTEDGSILFAGDCGDCEELRRMASGVGTLVIACALLGRREADAALHDVITGSSDVADIARESGAQRVILSHASPGITRPGARESAIAEVAQACSAAVLFPEELTTIDVMG
jgi:ribonuclease Z